MLQIRLPNGQWFYDPDKPLGRPGGFGKVFAGEQSIDNDRLNLAIKKLHIEASDAAHRELAIAEEFAGQNFEHVMPILDSGEDADSGALFVVMPKAEKTLLELCDQGSSHDDNEVATVLLDIVKGLQEVPNIVHRDLKPENILCHAGKWKIADFGIARFVEEATSLRTLKGCLSPLYAAPEQWELKPATHATDVYALGCIAYVLKTGKTPFDATDKEQLRMQHLEVHPPKLMNTVPRLESLFNHMLRKLPESRPTLARIQVVLEQFLECPVPSSNSMGFEVLAQATAKVSSIQAIEEQRLRKIELEKQQRNQIYKEARCSLIALLEKFEQRIENHSLTAVFNKSPNPFLVKLGKGSLAIGEKSSGLIYFPSGHFANSSWDVITGVNIILKQSDKTDYFDDRQWSASLWFGKPPDDEQYRWYEVGYANVDKWDDMVPFHLLGNEQEAVKALNQLSHSHGYRVVFGPYPIDDENEEEFFNRWAFLLGKASVGSLSRPETLPLERYFWRDENDKFYPSGGSLPEHVVPNGAGTSVAPIPLTE